MRTKRRLVVALVVVAGVAAPIGARAQGQGTQPSAPSPGTAAGSELASPVALQAAGAPIEIGALSSIAHAGPCWADVDGDGDRDLLVGDFPGYFWLFDNQGTTEKPEYAAGQKLQAGDKAAKVPVY